MSSYLIFAVVHCYPFLGLSMCKKLNCEFESVTFWYQILWRHDASQHFYEVFNDFVSVFKGLIFGKDFPWMSDQATKFLDKKGTLEQIENHNVIRIFGSKQNPSFIPCHISGTMFFAEITRQYTCWLHFFHEKRKRKFIPLPWKVGDFIVMNMNNTDSFVGHFHSFNLKCAEKVKGFDPDGIFVEHLLAIDFNSSFIDTILNDDEDNASGSPSHETNDLATILNTNESYKKKRKGPGEKSAQFPTATPKTTTF
jgi:hypothetical protein